MSLSNVLTQPLDVLEIDTLYDEVTHSNFDIFCIFVACSAFTVIGVMELGFLNWGFKCNIPDHCLD